MTWARAGPVLEGVAAFLYLMLVGFWPLWPKDRHRDLHRTNLATLRAPRIRLSSHFLSLSSP